MLQSPALFLESYFRFTIHDPPETEYLAYSQSIWVSLQLSLIFDSGRATINYVMKKIFYV
jgi:hypothetical protein